MKPWEEIVKKIKKNADKAAALEAEANAAPWRERDSAEIVKKYQAAEILRVENAILTDNARRAFVMELLPVALEELRKYAGKPYGEKTKEKISAAFHARTGHKFYISGGPYTNTISFICLNEKGFSGTGFFRYNDTDAETAWTNGENRRIIDDGNRINPAALEVDNFRVVNCAEYDETPSKTARALIRELNRLETKRGELESACSAYNRNIPSRMREARPTEYGRFRLFK